MYIEVNIAKGGEPTGAKFSCALGSSLDSMAAAPPKLPLFEDPSLTESRSISVPISAGSSDKSETRGRHSRDQAGGRHNSQADENRSRSHEKQSPAIRAAPDHIDARLRDQHGSYR